MASKSDLDRWRRRNAGKLKALGIPDRIVSNDRAFWIAVQENWDGEAGVWSASDLSDDEATMLFELLKEILGDVHGWDLLEALKDRIGR